jgi:hypothetical protein
VFSHAGGKLFVLLSKDAQILKRHVDPLAQDDGNTVIGKVVQSRTNPNLWGIANLTQTPWTGTLPDGSVKEYGPQKAVPLNPGIKLNIAGASAEIVV